MLVCPAKESCSNGESSSHRSQENEIASFQLAFIQCRLYSQGNCTGGCVPIFADVDDDAIRRHSQPFRRGSDDALICLMRYESSNVSAGESIARKDFL